MFFFHMVHLLCLFAATITQMENKSLPSCIRYSRPTWDYSACCLLSHPGNQFVTHFVVHINHMTDTGFLYIIPDDDWSKQLILQHVLGKPFTLSKSLVFATIFFSLYSVVIALFKVSRTLSLI